jgi:rfaE bifunctional protein nucleotidyltransferase chain/domain
MNKEKIKTREELKEVVDNLKKQDKKLVTTNGVFDILHIGHIKYLQEARKLGDVLIVAINSDASTKRLKGTKRPLNNENDRVEALAALECVDFVTIFDEDDPIKFLEVIKPNIHVKGGDYDISQIIEKETVEKNNGKITLIQEVKGYSTTDLINKILDLHGKQ